MPKTDDENLHLMSQNKSADVLKFHQSFPQYSETPLVQLRSLAAYLGVKDIFVKEES